MKSVCYEITAEKVMLIRNLTDRIKSGRSNFDVAEVLALQEEFDRLLHVLRVMGWQVRLLTEEGGPQLYFTQEQQADLANGMWSEIKKYIPIEKIKSDVATIQRFPETPVP